MGSISYVVPQAGTDLNSLADPEIATALNTIKTFCNGNIDAVNLSALLAQSVGANQNAQVVKGAVNIAASQSTSSAAYTTLATPDQVSGIVLPTNGLIAIGYQATWSETVQNAAKAAIFVGANQMKVAASIQTAPVVQEVGTGGNTAGNAQPISTGPNGLTTAGSVNYSGDVTTGQLFAANFTGGISYAFAAAGTYTVSVQFKTSSGSVTASGRKLWVQAIAFS